MALWRWRSHGSTFGSDVTQHEYGPGFSSQKRG